MGTLILVVEDNPDIATVLRDRLQAMGHEVMTVGDGQAALDALRQATPGLMFLNAFFDVGRPSPKNIGIAGSSSAQISCWRRRNCTRFVASSSSPI